MTRQGPLRVFVAMPGTDMGPNAVYKNPESVKKNLLKPVADKLEARLGREVELVIEKDKPLSAVIHASMFAEARDADVYIVDLTGANPNVYLELGVRWALRDRVTVPVVQDVKDLRFNVGGNRAILYSPDNLIEAIDKIADAVEGGLKHTACDSPVRLNSQFVEVPKSELDDLKAEIERLKRSRGEDLLRAATEREQLSERVPLLARAIEINPASVEAYMELGKTYMGLGKYGEAVAPLESARRLAPENAAAHRELGVCYSKLGQFAEAVGSLREAVRLAPGDGEAWSNLGGALRRLGMAGAPDAAYDEKALEEARDSYDRAHRIDRFDLYSGLNVARLDLLLSKGDPALLERAREGFRRQVHLCRHEVEEKPDDVWRKFDLADALLFSGQYVEGREVMTLAVEAVPRERRPDTLNSVLGPLRGYLKAGVLSGDLLAQVESVVAQLEAARQTA